MTGLALSSGWLVAARRPVTRVLCLCAATVGPVMAQGLTIRSALAVTETLTTNASGAGSGSGARGVGRGDAITQIAPSIAVSSQRGILQGSLSYTPTVLLYARADERNAINHSLAARGRLAEQEGRLGLDLGTNASLQAISAFGVQSADPSVGRDNQTQVYSYSLSPFMTGRLPGQIDYSLRAGYQQSISESVATGDTSTWTASAGVSGRSGLLGWRVDGTRRIHEQADRPRGHTGSIIASLQFAPDPQWVVNTRFGREVTDVVSGRSESNWSWGGGLQWRPGPRTSLAADIDRRYFGHSHSLVFSHRMARAAMTFSDVRSVQQGGNQTRAEISAFDLFFAQFASQEPDPVRREALVLSTLAANGIDPNSTVVVGGFLTSGPSVSRRQSLSLAYQGLRQSLVFSLIQSQTSRLGSDLASGDLADVGRIRQRGLTISLSHRLTPSSSLVFSSSLQDTAGVGTRSGNQLRSITATWSARLGQSSSVSLGVRHSDFDSDSNPYQESAVIGSVRMQF